MPNTSEGFYYPDANTNIAPLETVLANMAASSNSVAQQTPRVFANYAAMVAGVPSPVGGRLAITTQGSGILWQYDGTAAKWVVQNRPAFSDATARDAAIPSPSPGIVAVIRSGASYTEYRWTGASWVQTYVPWTAYVPAVAGLPSTVAEARFHRAGSLVTVQVRLAATGPATGSIAVGLPVAPRAYNATQSVGSAMAVIGAGIYSPAGVGIEGSNVVFWAPDTGRWGTQTNRPAAFASGSVLSFTVQYEPAA